MKSTYEELKSTYEELKKLINTPTALTYFRGAGEASGKVCTDADAVSLCVAVQDILLETCRKMDITDADYALPLLTKISANVCDALKLQNMKK